MSLWQCSNCLRTYTFEEIMRLEDQWVDETRRGYGKAMICRCGKKFMQDKWQLKTEHPTGYTVSTVHLELAHPSNLDTSDEIMWYQTMIKDKNGGFLPFQARYHYMKSAIDGHKLALELLPKILESPEKYPTDLISQILNKVER